MAVIGTHAYVNGVRAFVLISVTAESRLSRGRSVIALLMAAVRYIRKELFHWAADAGL